MQEKIPYISCKCKKILKGARWLKDKSHVSGSAISAVPVGPTSRALKKTLAVITVGTGIALMTAAWNWMIHIQAGGIHESPLLSRFVEPTFRLLSSNPMMHLAPSFESTRFPKDHQPDSRVAVASRKYLWHHSLQPPVGGNPSKCLEVATTYNPARHSLFFI